MFIYLKKQKSTLQSTFDIAIGKRIYNIGKNKIHNEEIGVIVANKSFD
jgi:hypothetical protein